MADRKKEIELKSVNPDLLLTFMPKYNIRSRGISNFCRQKMREKSNAVHFDEN